jgi:hypothetical protein
MHHRPETRASLVPSPSLRSRGNTLWTNALALTAVAVAIALLVAKNRDRNPSSHFPKVSAISLSDDRPKAP